MAGPPSNSKEKTPDDLAEVERALSVLKGRTPEFERARREDEEARRKRRAAIESASHEEARRARTRRVLTGAIVVVVAGFAVWGGTVFRSEVARRGHVEEASDAYRAMGFVVAETSGRSAPGRLEETTDKGCFVAVSTGEAPIVVTRAAGAIEGTGPVVFCTCATEKVTVTSNVDAAGGLALLRIDAAAIGGSRAFAFLPFEPGTTAASDEACADESLDAWVEGKRYPAQPAPPEGWAKTDAGAALARLGFSAIGAVPEDRPFSVIDLPKDSCTVALAGREDVLALRLRGGTKPIAKAAGAFGWCAPAPATVIVERKGKGEVTVVAAPAARVGGTVGLAEELAAAGVRVAPEAMGVAPEDHAWNGKQLLVASAVPEGMIATANAPEIAPDAEARIVAASFGRPNALLAEPGDEVFSFCEPALGGESLDAMCVFSGKHRWKLASAESVGGVARAKMPFWLFGLDGVSDPAAMKAAADLVTFARRMRRRGFEPTTIEAMTETPSGLEVLGRAGEDAIVALGVAPVAPWIFPYTDGPAWRLEDEEPRIVPIGTLEKVRLSSVLRALPSKDTRRSVVFRRQAAP